MGRKLTEAQRRLILAMPSHRSSREVAALVGVGHTAVAEVRQEAARAISAPRRPPVARPAPSIVPPAPEPAADHGALLHALVEAETHEEAREAAIALQRFEHPKFAYCLDHGMTVPEALMESWGVPYELLGTPLDIAFIAHMATDFLSGFDDEAERRQAEVEAHTRAVALLEQALEVLRAANPENVSESLLGKRTESEPFYAEWIAKGNAP